MKNVSFCLAVVVLLWTAVRTNAAPTNPAPDFQEVFNLVRDQLKDADTAEMNRAAVQGLMQKLGGRVALADGAAESAAAGPLAKLAVFDDGVGYARARRVDEGLAGKLVDVITRLK